jgi:arylformamidase
MVQCKTTRRRSWNRSWCIVRLDTSVVIAHALDAGGGGGPPAGAVTWLDPGLGDDNMASPWIDVSVPVKTGMVHWPGDPAVRLTQSRSLDRGDSCTASLLGLGVHTGTHMDAPAHFVRGGQTIDELPLDAVIGPARVIDVRSIVSVEPRALARHHIRRGERILFRTRNSRRCWRGNAFVRDFVSLSPAAADYLAERQVRLVGIDYLSVGAAGNGGRETHVALLGAGIWVIEGLNLSLVRPGPVDLICLPLKLLGADGAPARVVVRERLAR